ncbi:MAG: metallophosphoesterase [Alphaproteobacteria bacterium]|nr:metallophosphoesterase [Alphaproteobacteria bacterium]
MYFMIAYLVIAVSCILITGRTLTSYNETALWLKIGVYLILTYAWFSPMIVWNLQASNTWPTWLYAVFAKFSYFLFGFAFLLVIALIGRDLLWQAAHFIVPQKVISPSNPAALKCANYAVMAIIFICSLYAVYAAEKMPWVLHYGYADARIKRPLKLLVISDLHITKMTSVQKVRRWVEYFNALKADMILMPGDIGDDRPADIKEQISALKKLKAPLGIYYTIGNHESYFNALAWEGEFAALGWQVLHNSGVEAENTGLYIAGVPDSSTMSAHIAQAVQRAKPEDYRILLSHNPTTALNAQKGEVDLQISGHTHGGQIFPFNWLTSWGNKGFVSGQYNLENTTLLVSHGAGYWGPPMRLGAPSDILLISLNKSSPEH